MPHKDPQQRRAYADGWHVAHPGARRGYDVTYKEGHREAMARTYRRAKLATYGLTPDDYQAIFARQDGRCAICGDRQSRRALAVDHNHNTDTVRGLLCDRCNRGLGLLGDSPELLIEAAAYLRRNI